MQHSHQQCIVYSCYFLNKSHEHVPKGNDCLPCCGELLNTESMLKIQRDSLFMIEKILDIQNKIQNNMSMSLIIPKLFYSVVPFLYIVFF